MLRYGLFQRPLNSRTSRLSARFYAIKRGGDTDEEEVAAARRWLANFDPETLPRSICDVSFSRSSGPGGQNVNKYAMLIICGVSIAL